MKYLIVTLFLSSILYSQNMKTADSLMSIGQFSKAIVEYQKEAKIEKYFKMAKAFESVGNSKLAHLNYQKYLEKDTLNLQVNYNYGLLLLELGKNKTAQKVFQQLVNSNSSAEYQYCLGLAFERDHDQQNSIFQYLHSAKVDSLYFKSNYKLAVFYSNGGNYKEALKITNRFLVQNEEHIEMLKLQAQLYFNTGEFKKAIHDFKTLLELNQTDTFIFEKLAKAYYEVKEYKKCITLYTTLIDDSERENPDYFFSRGKAYGYLGKVKEAEADIKKAIEMKSFTFESEYLYLAYFYQKEQNLERALYYHKKVLNEDKNNTEANYQVIAIQDYKGENLDKLIKSYEGYLIKFKNIKEERKLYIESRIKQLKQKVHME